MPKKKHQRKSGKTLRREDRLAKARKWVKGYTGSHIIRDYRKKFTVDPTCAINDMEAIGALSPEQLANLRKGEEARLFNLAKQREQKSEDDLMDRYPDSDDRFFYIAGYTSGGAPYGVTWEEMGLEPYELLDDE
jgi:hypothetical protein